MFEVWDVKIELFWLKIDLVENNIVRLPRFDDIEIAF